MRTCLYDYESGIASCYGMKWAHEFRVWRVGLCVGRLDTALVVWRPFYHYRYQPRNGFRAWTFSTPFLSFGVRWYDRGAPRTSFPE